MLGSISGSLASTSGSIDGYPATLAVQGNDLVLTVVPEPSTLALLGAGAVLLGYAWRRRSRKVKICTLFVGLLGSGGLLQAGNFFVSNYNSNTIEQYSSTGVDLGLFASTGLSQPQGMVLDGSGNLYVANWSSNTIEKFSPTGKDLGTFASTGMDSPCGLALDANGNLYVANWGNSTIERYSPAGRDLGVFASSGLDQPAGLGFDSSGNLYAVNWGNGTVEKFAPNGGNGSLFASSTNLDHPAGLAFDGSGRLYVASYWGTTIERFSSTGADLGVFASGLNGPDGLAFDSSGNLYVANQTPNTLVKIGRHRNRNRLREHGHEWAGLHCGAGGWASSQRYLDRRDEPIVEPCRQRCQLGRRFGKRLHRWYCRDILRLRAHHNITIAGGGVQPGSVTFTNNTTSYSFTGGAISGPAAITLEGSGSVTFSNANAYTGMTTLSNGVLELASSENAGVSGPLGVGGAIAFFGGTLQYSASNAYDYSGRFSTASGQAYTVDTNGQTVTWATGLTSSGGNLTKVGNGTLILTGTNTCAGGTLISGGTLQLGDGTAGHDGALAGNIANNAALVCNLNGSQSYAGSISGSGSLTKTGPGMLSLGGTSSFTGGTTLAGGTLKITNNLAIGPGTIVLAGGTLSLGTLSAPAPPKAPASASISWAMAMPSPVRRAWSP